MDCVEDPSSTCWVSTKLDDADSQMFLQTVDDLTDDLCSANAYSYVATITRIYQYLAKSLIDNKGPLGDDSWSPLYDKCSEYRANDGDAAANVKDVWSKEFYQNGAAAKKAVLAVDKLARAYLNTFSVLLAIYSAIQNVFARNLDNPRIARHYRKAEDFKEQCLINFHLEQLGKLYPHNQKSIDLSVGGLSEACPRYFRMPRGFFNCNDNPTCKQWQRPDSSTCDTPVQGGGGGSVPLSAVDGGDGNLQEWCGDDVQVHTAEYSGKPDQSGTWTAGCSDGQYINDCNSYAACRAATGDPKYLMNTGIMQYTGEYSGINNPGTYFAKIWVTNMCGNVNQEYNLTKYQTHQGGTDASRVTHTAYAECFRCNYCASTACRSGVMQFREMVANLV